MHHHRSEADRQIEINLPLLFNTICNKSLKLFKRIKRSNAGLTKFYVEGTWGEKN